VVAARPTAATFVEGDDGCFVAVSTAWPTVVIRPAMEAESTTRPNVVGT